MRQLTITKTFRIFFFTLILFWNCNSFAAENILEKYSPELSEIEIYLNNIKNLSARFIQETDGSKVEGKFYLSRPGKMRIEYLAQPKVILTVNGSVLSYLDVELDEISNLSTNTTPASLLTRENISFSAKDVEVTDVKKTPGQIKVSVMKKNRKEAGEFSLIFKTNPLQFIKMEVKNDLNQVIKVSLVDTDFNSEIPKNLFVLKNKILPQ
jgi:outer membrane lipoprotein-sorting protein